MSPTIKENMFIIDDKAKKNLNRVTLILTKEEIRQMLGYAEQLLEDNISSEHYHLSNSDYRKEITICLYNPSMTDQFNPAIQKLINENSQ